MIVVNDVGRSEASVLAAMINVVTVIDDAGEVNLGPRAISSA